MKRRNYQVLGFECTNFQLPTRHRSREVIQAAENQVFSEEVWPGRDMLVNWEIIIL